jgi:hypothetical protein
MNTSLLATSLALSLLLPAAASAGVGDPPPAPTIGKHEESPKFMSAGITFGGMAFQDENITAGYGEAPGFLPRLSIGVIPWSKFVHFEIRTTLAFTILEGSQRVVSTGATSADNVGLSVFPLTVDLLLGVDIVDEQPVVPYGGIGIAWSPWRETERDDELFGPGALGELIGRGDRFGFNAFFGGAFLLDVVEPERAGRLDAKAGVNDSYLVVEGRWNRARLQLQDGEWDESGLDFSGWSFHVGVKLTY